MFSLLILDFNLPQFNALEIVTTLNETLKTKGQPSPEIVMVSAYISTADRSKLEIQGVKTFVDKPITATVLKDLLTKHQFI